MSPCGMNSYEASIATLPDCAVLDDAATLDPEPCLIDAMNACTSNESEELLDVVLEAATGIGVSGTILPVSNEFAGRLANTGFCGSYDEEFKSAPLPPHAWIVFPDTAGACCFTMSAPMIRSIPAHTQRLVYI